MGENTTPNHLDYSHFLNTSQLIKSEKIQNHTEHQNP
jgi:hypothetical protein